MDNFSFVYILNYNFFKMYEWYQNKKNSLSRALKIALLYTNRKQ